METPSAGLEAPALSLSALQATMAARQAEYDQLREQYDDLWQQRRTLDDMGYLRLKRTEDHLGFLGLEITALKPQIDAARQRDTVLSAQANHDVRLPRAQTLAEQTLEAIGHLAGLLAALKDEFGQMVDPLTALHDQHNRQVFDLKDGHNAVLEFVQAAFPGNSHAPTMAHMLIQTPPTVGNCAEALQGCPRLKPFSETAITRYLNTMTEGTPHE